MSSPSTTSIGIPPPIPKRPSKDVLIAWKNRQSRDLSGYDKSSLRWSLETKESEGDAQVNNSIEYQHSPIIQLTKKYESMDSQSVESVEEEQIYQESEIYFQEIRIPAAELKVDILEKNQKPFVVYAIQVILNNGDSWFCGKRFSELFRFDRDLLQLLKKKSLKPKFPSRFTGKNSLSPHLIEMRRGYLEKYLNQVAVLGKQDYKVLEVQSLFLKPEPDWANSPNRRLSRSYSSGGSSVNINDRALLKARALRRELLVNKLEFMKPPRESNIEDRDLLCITLGTLVVPKQSFVDEFAEKMIRLYPSSLFLTQSKTRMDRTEDDDDLSVADISSLQGETKSSKRQYLKRLFSKRRSRDASMETPEYLLARVHRFIAQISWKTLQENKDVIDQNVPQGFAEEFQFEVIYRLFEAATITRHPELRDLLFLCCKSCDSAAENDKRFRTKIDRLIDKFGEGGIPPSLFGACAHPLLDPDSLPDGGLPDDFCWGWDECVASLRRLEYHDSFSSPSAKAEIILDSIRVIERSFGSKDPTQPGQEPRVLGADDIIPVFFYVLARAQLSSPNLVYQYVSAIASEALMSTEVKYWLTVFQSGLEYISTLEV